MERKISVCSVSRPVWVKLIDTEFNGEVLAVFRRACIFGVEPCSGKEGSGVPVMALVLPEIGDGPLNIVLDAQVSALADIQPGQAVCFRPNRLRIGGMCLLFERASIWEPRPEWDQLRSQYQAVTRGLECVLSLALRCAAPTSMLELLRPAVTTDAPKLPFRECFAAARRGLEALEAGWRRGTNSLQAGVSQLAGLGPGLTPAGDDFLAGVMFYLWLRHPAPIAVCRSMLQVAVPSTTLLSAAMLRRAAAGECDADWHRLFYAIASADRQRIDAAVRLVLSHGSTSGGDTLAGFLWMNRLQSETWPARFTRRNYDGVSAASAA